MKTLVFVRKNDSKSNFINCRIFEGNLTFEQIKKHVFKDEKLLNYEYADTILIM